MSVFYSNADLIGHYPDNFQIAIPECVSLIMLNRHDADNALSLWLGKHFAHGLGGLPVGILDPDCLRDGHFTTDPQAIGNVSIAVNQLRAVDGISVFDYGDYLVSR